mmetsp:Transcript_16368/g.18475  ORF Transcript_16368/g.18475 Transcript_16368/m.18475 type:complete len:283 (+) Transcript_16368:348-1196(+)
MSHIVASIDSVVGSIDVISTENLLEDFRFMNNTFLHENEDGILQGGGLEFFIEIQLGVQFVFQLTFFVNESSLINIFFEILLVFSKQVEVMVFGPRPPSITGQLTDGNLNDLSSTQEMNLVNSPSHIMNIPSTGPPHGGSGQEEPVLVLPGERQGIDIVHPNTEGDQTLIENIRVFQIDVHMLEGIARIEQAFSNSVEFNGMRRLVDFLSLSNNWVILMSVVNFFSMDFFVQVSEVEESSEGNFSQTLALVKSSLKYGSRRTGKRFAQHLYFSFSRFPLGEL